MAKEIKSRALSSSPKRVTGSGPLPDGEAAGCWPQSPAVFLSCSPWLAGGVCFHRRTPAAPLLIHPATKCFQVRNKKQR